MTIRPWMVEGEAVPSRNLTARQAGPKEKLRQAAALQKRDRRCLNTIDPGTAAVLYAPA